MTENEFFGLIKKIEYGDSAHINTYYYEIIKAAKEHGAKFDPEPVKPVNLPELAICGGPASFVISSTNDYRLSAEEAQEVLRRCNLIPQLSDLIARRWSSLSGAELLRYLSGAVPVPVPDADHTTCSEKYGCGVQDPGYHYSGTIDR